MDMIDTNRLILRTWEEHDVDDFFSYAKSEVIGPSAGWPPHSSIEESRNIIDQFIKGNAVWAIEHKEARKVIGSLGLHRDHKRSTANCKMIGYALSKDFWGQGLIPEAVKAVLSYAFTTLELDLVSLYHYPRNIQSKRVIEKCGFQYEGILRYASKNFDNTIHDDVCYSMTKEEFMKQNESLSSGHAKM